MISEWKFQKDGVDVAMKDITTENKAAQVGRAGLGWTGVTGVCHLAPCPCNSFHRATLTLPPVAANHRRSTTAACSWAWTPTGWRAGTCATRTALSARWVVGLWRVQLLAGGLRPGPAARAAARLSRRLIAHSACCSSCRQAASPIVNYAGGKDYARGTKFRCALLWVGCNVMCFAAVRPDTQQGSMARICCVPDQPRVPLRPALPSLPPMCSCMATSGDGYVVVGADDGKVSRGGQQGLVCGQPGQAGEPAGGQGRQVSQPVARAGRSLSGTGLAWCPHPSFSLARCVATPCPTCPHAGAAVQ